MSPEKEEIKLLPVVYIHRCVHVCVPKPSSIHFERRLSWVQQVHTHTHSKSTARFASAWSGGVGRLVLAWSTWLIAPQSRWIIPVHQSTWTTSKGEGVGGRGHAVQLACNPATRNKASGPKRSSAWLQHQKKTSEEKYYSLMKRGLLPMSFGWHWSPTIST